jgi:hypothetical protein
MLPKNLRGMKIGGYSLFPACAFLKRMFEFLSVVLLGWRAMSQNMPSLNRVLATAALASVVIVLLMSYQWGRAAAEPPIAKVIRLHPK